MATAIASESASQLARLGLSEQDFKRKTELMRLYLQDSSGAASFDEFCQKQPAHLPDPVHPPQPSKPAPPESSKNVSNNAQKQQPAAPPFSSMGLPLSAASLNPQMFGMMPTSQLQRHVFPMPMPMPGMVPGQPLQYYPPVWFNPAMMMPGQPVGNPWAALMGQAPVLAPQPNITTAPRESNSSRKQGTSKKAAVIPKEEDPPSVTPKTPKRKLAEASPFTPAPAAVFISPSGSQLAGTPIAAIMRPDGTFVPTPLFHSPGMDLVRPAKQPPPAEEIDVSTIFKLPDPPYSSSKPSYSYAALIGQALNASHRGRACLDHIYLYISTVYPYYKRGEQAWQNSIRHNLSQNSSFTRLKHPSGGQHGEWAIRDEDKHCFANGGYVRSARAQERGRKRRRKGAFDDDTDLEEDISPRKRARKALVAEDGADHASYAGDEVDSVHLANDLGSDDEDSDAFQLPTRRDIVNRSKNSTSTRGVAKQSSKQSHKGSSKITRPKGKRKRSYKDSEDEAISEDESEFELSPLFGKGKELPKEPPLSFAVQAKDDQAARLDAILQSDAHSSMAGSISPPLDSAAASEWTSEMPSDGDDLDLPNFLDDDRDDLARRQARAQDFMERTLMEKAKAKELARQERFRSVPAATLLNLSPMRRLSTSPLKSAIRGTGPGPLLDDIMSRFPVNSDRRDEDSHSGEDSAHEREREGEEDERDRSVTPPPLIPNPPWMASPASRTPDNRVDSDDDVGLLLSVNPLIKQTSICISPNSSHLHSQQSAFMTPARATASEPRAFDTSFPIFPPLSSPIRSQASTADPLTPTRPTSGYGSMFMHTPMFPSSFSETRLEDELARMARGDDSPGAFFDRSVLYRSPSIPGSSPKRWQDH